MDLEREAGAKPWPTLDVILMNADSILQVGWGDTSTRTGEREDGGQGAQLGHLC